MNIDVDILGWNTPEARSGLINAPAVMRTLTLETYAARAHQPVPEGVLDWLARIGTPEQRNLLLCGKPGRGKTGLGIGLLRVLAERKVGSMFRWNLATAPGVRKAIAEGRSKEKPSPCWFERWPRLLSLQKRNSWDEEGWFELLDECTTVLMLDDIGIDAGTLFRESFLLRHIEWTEDKDGRALILTLNVGTGAWGATFGERIVDRLLERRRFDIVELQGENLRD